MKWEFDLLKKGIITVRTNGEYDSKHFITMMEQVFFHPEWKPGMKAFFDNQDFSLSGLDNNTMFNLGKQYKELEELIGRARIALLMRTIADYNVAHEFQYHIKKNIDVDIGVFLRRNEAVEKPLFENAIFKQGKTAGKNILLKIKTIISKTRKHESSVKKGSKTQS